MNSIESMLTKVRMLEQSVELSHFRECLKEVVQCGEDFLQKYDIQEGLAKYSSPRYADFLHKRDMSCFNAPYSPNIPLLDELNIMEFYGYSFKVDYHSNLCKECVYIHPLEIEPNIYSLGLAYLISIKQFRTKDFSVIFELPAESSSLSIFEKAFAYALIVPYSYYKQLLKDFFDIIESSDIEFFIKYTNNRNKIWFEYASKYFLCDVYTMSIISEFYGALFSEEIQTIILNSYNKIYSFVQQTTRQKEQNEYEINQQQIERYRAERLRELRDEQEKSVALETAKKLSSSLRSDNPLGSDIGMRADKHLNMLFS